MFLFECCEFFQCQWVYVFELGEFVFGVGQMVLLDMVVEGDCCVVEEFVGCGFCFWILRNELVGFIFCNENIFVQGEFRGYLFEEVV